MPFPPHYNWLQLQKYFDRFRKSLRSRFFFSNKEDSSNNNFRNNNEVNYPQKKKSNWLALKIDSPELQIFLTSLEKYLFSNTKANDVKDNFSEEERSSLKN